MDGKITTVLGEIQSGQLGYTQCHEHILLRKGKSCQVNACLCMEDIGKSISELINYKNAGGDSLVDAQPIGCGRMERELAHISKISGVNLIASTGFHKMEFYPQQHWIYRMSGVELEGIFEEELCCGMYLDCDHISPSLQSSYRAGIIKTALDKPGILEKQYEKLFTAAAKAAGKTGKPIMIHIEKGSDPLRLLRFLESRGVLPAQMIFCHLDRTCEDLNVHKTLCQKGAYLDYDTIGRFKYHSDKEEVRKIREMIDSGYIRHLLLSLDTTNQRLHSYGGTIGLTYIKKVFQDKLKADGISDQQICTMMLDNPRDILSGGIKKGKIGRIQ